MLISGEQGRFYLPRHRTRRRIHLGRAGPAATCRPTALDDRVTYYDAVYPRTVPIRAVALRVPVRPGSGKGAILIQVAEKRAPLRTDFARQIMLRMMLPQAILVLLATLAVWFGVGHRPARADLHAHAKSKTARTST